MPGPGQLMAKMVRFPFSVFCVLPFSVFRFPCAFVFRFPFSILGSVSFGQAAGIAWAVGFALAFLFGLAVQSSLVVVSDPKSIPPQPPAAPSALSCATPHSKEKGSAAWAQPLNNANHKKFVSNITNMPMFCCLAEHHAEGTTTAIMNDGPKVCE